MILRRGDTFLRAPSAFAIPQKGDAERAARRPRRPLPAPGPVAAVSAVRAEGAAMGISTRASIIAMVACR